MQRAKAPRSVRSAIGRRWRSPQEDRKPFETGNDRLIVMTVVRQPFQAGRDARFFYPQGIASDATGQLYVSSGTTVRKGLLATLSVISAQPQSLSVVAGNSASFSVTATAVRSPSTPWKSSPEK